MKLIGAVLFLSCLAWGQGYSPEEQAYLDSVEKLRSQNLPELTAEELSEIETAVVDLNAREFTVREAASDKLSEMSRKNLRVLLGLRKRRREKSVPLEAQARIKLIFRASSTLVDLDKLSLLMRDRVLRSAEAKALNDEVSQVLSMRSSEDRDAEVAVIDSLFSPVPVFDGAEFECVLGKGGLRGHVSGVREARAGKLYTLLGMHQRRLRATGITEFVTGDADPDKAMEGVVFHYTRGERVFYWRIRYDGSCEIVARPVSGGYFDLDVSPEEVAPPLSRTEWGADVADFEPLKLELAVLIEARSAGLRLLASPLKSDQDLDEVPKVVLRYFQGK